MTTITCPTCGHPLDPATTGGTDAPDTSVFHWFRVDQSWMGEASADEVYGNYLRSIDETPVSRKRFVADLAYFGVESVLDGDTLMLVRT